MKRMVSTLCLIFLFLPIIARTSNFKYVGVTTDKAYFYDSENIIRANTIKVWIWVYLDADLDVDFQKTLARSESSKNMMDYLLSHRDYSPPFCRTKDMLSLEKETFVTACTTAKIREYQVNVQKRVQKLSMLTEINCSTGQSRILSAVQYDDNRRISNFLDTPNAEWTFHTPTSPTNFVASFTCQK